MAKRFNVSLPDSLAKRYQKFADKISLSELVQKALEEKLRELQMDTEILRIRTRNDLTTLRLCHATGEWEVSRERLAGCRRIEIYNWDRTECLAGEIDHSRIIESTLQSKRFIIGFNPETLEPVPCEPIEWVGRGSFRYVPND